MHVVVAVDQGGMDAHHHGAGAGSEAVEHGQVPERVDPVERGRQGRLEVGLDALPLREPVRPDVPLDLEPGVVDPRRQRCAGQLLPEPGRVGDALRDQSGQARRIGQPVDHQHADLVPRLLRQVTGEQGRLDSGELIGHRISLVGRCRTPT